MDRHDYRTAFEKAFLGQVENTRHHLSCIHELKGNLVMHIKVFDKLQEMRGTFLHNRQSDNQELVASWWQSYFSH